MAYGALGFSQGGTVSQASPSIWGDCGNHLLTDLALGYFFVEDFIGNYGNPATVTPSFLQSDADTGSTFLNASSATYGPNVLAITVSNTDNNAAAIFGTELGQIVRNSGNKFWFEARIAVGALGDSAFFLGLTTLANAATGRDIITDDPGNGAPALAAASVIGFRSFQVSNLLAKVDTIYSKGAGTIVAGNSTTPNGTLQDVTNATALIAYQAASEAARPGTVITQAAGVTLQATAPIGEGIQIAYGNLVANGFRKFGIRFDGIKTIYWYVDGVVVSRTDVDSTVDQTSYYVPVFAQKTDGATAVTNYMDFIRAGYQARS